MKKIILVDGNNLLFRSYYATAYNGNFMKNSKGFPTNALYGFVNMISKIINEENPQYIIVAFDKGKTFRHIEYEGYKDGRVKTPDELKMQFPKAKEILTAMGIKYYEIDNYEADDIIGTFSEYCNKKEEFIGTIISSDKDLLQLITKDVDIKLLKQKDYIRYDETSFKKEWGIDPINIIDLKALMGDPSDNIPGVKGVGEKTALKLLHDYKTLDGIYENIENVKGKLKEKLINDRENAYKSYHLATIVKDVDMDIDIDDCIYRKEDTDNLNNIYEDLEFYSFLKKKKEKKSVKETEIKVIKNVDEIKVDKDVAVYLEILGTNYHKSHIIGMGVYNDDISYYIPLDVLKQNPKFLKENKKYTYDLKKMLVSLKYQNVDIDNVVFDTMIAGSLLDYNMKDDISYLANQLDYDLKFYENIYGKLSKLSLPDEEEIIKETINRARFIWESKDELNKKIKEEDIEYLFNEIEMPLSIVLADMEYTGVKVDSQILKNQGESIKIKIELVSNDIYNLAGEKFNISSPKQLSKILFEKLDLPHKKNSTSTAIDVLNKLREVHPIIDKIIEYRKLTKVYNTYIEGILSEIKDGKVHTIYTQNLTRTGRLSSIEPNLQNIPIRDQIGRDIRKAFIPNFDYIYGADYSQIELRIFTHMADIESLKQAFIKGEDIHTKTASDIFKVAPSLVTSNQRRVAKAVNFGIIYGISSFGLGDNVGISNKEAKQFIDTYLMTYPGIKDYMEKTVKEAKEKGSVKTLFGRKRNIPEINNTVYLIRQSGERIALNTPIQGTAADIIKLAMVKVYKALKDNNLKSKMIIQVHDELVFDVYEDEIKKLDEIVTEIMDNVYKLSVPLKVTKNYGKSWYDAK
ncbi:MAG: DNA polymerase I [Bacilli bacterium]|nr:DNA polymerase I [Bacilli bacterium]